MDRTRHSNFAETLWSKHIKQTDTRYIREKSFVGISYDCVLLHAFRPRFFRSACCNDSSKSECAHLDMCRRYSLQKTLLNKKKTQNNQE